MPSVVMLSSASIYDVTTQHPNEFDLIVKIIRNAEREAVTIRKGADGYACEVLTNLDEVMDRALGEVRRGKEKLESAVR